MQLIHSFIRNFKRNRLYTIINIAGLATGLSAFCFIILYILDELSYDKYNMGYKQIYRLESNIVVSDKQQHVAKSSYAIGPAFLREFPEVAGFVRFRGLENCFLSADEKKFYEDDLYYCDSSVFDIFTCTFIHGNPSTALSEPNTLVMTERLALKYFGTTNPIDKTVYVKNTYPCRVTAVIKDIPENSHMRYSGLISLPTIKNELGESMYNDLNTIHFWALRLYTYVKLKEGASMEQVNNQFPAFHDKYIADLSKKMNGSFELETCRLDKIHLYNRSEWDLPKGNIQTIYILYAIALFILIIAGINYVNLATARSACKAREVGLRKVMGANRRQISWFYITDALFLSFLALIVSLVIIELLLPYFNQITDKSLSFEPASNPKIYLILLFTTLVIGFFSGIYPAYYLASFQPYGVLTQKRILGPTEGLFRKLLIIFQFSISIAMVAGSLVIKSQVEFIRKRDLGFNKDNLIVIRATDSTFKKQIEVFEQKIKENPDILDMVTTNTLPGLGNYLDVFSIDGPVGHDRYLMNLMFVGEGFIDLMEMNIIEGRNFYPSSEADRKGAAIINKTAAIKLGWRGSATGRHIYRRGYDREDFTVVGVVDDLVFSSLYEEIGPIAIFPETSPGDLLCVRLSKSHGIQTIDGISKVWEQMNPGEPFKYNYLTDKLNQLYANEFKLNKVILSFAFLALFIALLGLYGLTSFITERSSKNIGIRKLLGASSAGIALQFSKKVTWLIVAAILIATPVAWILMENWLNHFAYRIQLKITWFLFAWLIVLIIAQLTVITQTLKAASSDPADVIRYE